MFAGLNFYTPVGVKILKNADLRGCKMEVFTVKCLECETRMPVLSLEMDIGRRKVKAELWCYACQIGYVMIITEGKPVMIADRKQLS